MVSETEQIANSQNYCYIYWFYIAYDLHVGRPDEVRVYWVLYGNVQIVFDGTFHPFGRHLVKSVYQKIIFVILNQNMLWVLKRTINEVSHYDFCHILFNVAISADSIRWDAS